jgi:dipeptidyl aminopeptidase/acylaminoacyl peptidase
MRSIVFISTLMLLSILIPAQKKVDTLEAWMSKFYRLTNPVLSESGKWAAVRKRYDLKQDTVIIINTKFPNIPASTLILSGSETFLKDDGLLLTGSGKVEFLHLNSGTVKHYDNIRSSYTLPEARQYAVLTNDAVLKVYAVDGKLQHQMAGITVLPVTDHNGNLYVCTALDHGYQVSIISKKGLRRLSVVEFSVNEMEVSPSGAQLFVTGKEGGTGNPILAVIDTKDGMTATLKAASSGNIDFFNITEIGDGKACFIALYNVEQPKSEVVDIWYGNDDNLDAKKTGRRTGRFWLWRPSAKHFELLPDDVYPAMASLNSERYFLAYHPTKGHNFVTLEPQFIDTSIYDVQQKTYNPLGTLKGVTSGSPEVICSKDGRWIVLSEDNRLWTSFDLQKKEKHLIEQTGLRNPVFSDNGSLAFFESENGLWKYDLANKTLSQTEIARGRSVSMINITDYKTSYNSQIGVKSFEAKSPLLLEIKDRDNNLTSYSILKGKNIEEIMPLAKDKVGRLAYNDGLTHLLTLEENFNKPPQLYTRSEGKKKLLLDGSNADPEARLLKQEIIHYTTAEGLPLKGILYYPLHYEPNKKYPIVVYIYQILSEKSNEYLTPSYNNRDGLDIRAMTKRGYFVLLPDTAVGPAGPGLSALDCVHKALDAAGQNPNIDMQKVGLVGHSFGGYETNFIATHSRRFAAYISGAGISDITRSYFSYNYHFPGPYYWQFETGILSMPAFADGKEIYVKNNPIHYVEKVNAPILLWTGREDENVPWDQTTEFFIGLKSSGKPVIALFYPKGRHAFAYNSQEKKDLYTKVMEWWDYFFKDKKNVPWINEQMKKGAL